MVYTVHISYMYWSLGTNAGRQARGVTFTLGKYFSTIWSLETNMFYSIGIKFSINCHQLVSREQYVLQHWDQIFHQLDSRDQTGLLQCIL